MGMEILEWYIPDCSCSSKAAPQVGEAAQCRTGMIARIQSNVSSLCMRVQFLQRNRKGSSGDSADGPSPTPKAATLFRKPGPATRGSERISAPDANEPHGDEPCISHELIRARQAFLKNPAGCRRETQRGPDRPWLDTGRIAARDFSSEECRCPREVLHLSLRRRV